MSAKESSIIRVSFPLACVLRIHRMGLPSFALPRSDVEAGLPCVLFQARSDCARCGAEPHESVRCWVPVGT